MNNLHFDVMNFWMPDVKQMKYRLDGDYQTKGAMLENIPGKLFIYWSMPGVDVHPIYEQILDGLNMYGGIIPRIVYYGDKDMNAEEEKENLWRRVNDSNCRPCQIRIDSGIGQMPTALIGLYSIWQKTGHPKAFELFTMQALTIADHNYRMTYEDREVPQGNMFSYFPLPMNNMLEAQCIAEIAKTKIPSKQQFRLWLSVLSPMLWDNQINREIPFWFLAKMNPGQYKDKFKKWIKGQDKRLAEMKARYDKNAEANTDVFKADLNYLIGLKIRETI